MKRLVKKMSCNFYRSIAVLLFQSFLLLPMSGSDTLLFAAQNSRPDSTLSPVLKLGSSEIVDAYVMLHKQPALSLVTSGFVDQTYQEADTKDKLDALINTGDQLRLSALFQEVDYRIRQTGLGNASARDRYLFISFLVKGQRGYLEKTTALNHYAFDRLQKLFSAGNKQITFSAVAKELLAAELENGNLNIPFNSGYVPGMPKILLVGPYRSSIGEREIGAFLSPPLGVHRISSFARQFGVQADVYDIDLLGLEGLLEKVRNEHYDFVMFSVYHQTIANGLNGMHEVKKTSPQTIIVAGGQGIIDREPINNVELIYKNAPVDVMVRGFGEFAVLDMAVNLKKGTPLQQSFGTIPGLVFADGRKTSSPGRYSSSDFRVISYGMDFEQIPYAMYWQHNNETMGQRDIFKMARMVTESHCPFKCTFCSARVFLDIAVDETQPVLYLSPEDIIRLLNRFIDVYPDVEAIYLHDDDFFLNKRRVKEFIRLLKQGTLKKDLKFFAQGRTDDLDKAALRELYDVGFRIISYGQESGSQKVLDDLRKDNNAAASGGILYDSMEVGILPHINLILFPPKTTLQDIQQSVEMALPLIEAGAHIAISGRVLVLPGASMAEEGYDIIYREAVINATGKTIKVPYLFQPVDPRMQEIAEQADGLRDEKVAQLKEDYSILQRLPQQIDGLCYFWAVYTLAGLETGKIDYVIHRLLEKEMRAQKRATKAGRAFSLGEEVALPDLDNLEIAVLNNENNAQLLIVSDCPLRCRFCINFEFTQDGVFRPLFLKWDEVKYRQLLDKLKKSGIYALTLTGGEPSYHPHLADFVRVAKEEGMRVRVTSNGLGLNEDVLEKLHAAGLDNLTFSVFSFDEMQYRRISAPELVLIHDKAGTIHPVLSRVKQNLRYALDAGLDPRLNIIITRDTYPDGVKHIVEQARAMGVRKFQLKELSVEEGIRFTQDQYVEIREDILGELFPGVEFYKNRRFQEEDMQGFISYNKDDPSEIDLSVVIFSFERAKRLQKIRDIFVNPFASLDRFATSGRDPKTSASALFRNGELVQLPREKTGLTAKGNGIRIGFLHGRYQPPHFGHLELLRKALAENDRVIVLVGANKTDDDKNPIPQGLRVRALQTFSPQEIMSGRLVVAFNDDIYDEEALEKTDWGQRYYNFIREFEKEGAIRVYTGPNGDNGWWEKFSDVEVIRSEKRINDISATQIREGAPGLAPDLSYQLLSEALQVEHEKADASFESAALPETIPESMNSEAEHFGTGICFGADYEGFFERHMKQLWGDGRTTGLAKLAAFLADQKTPTSGFMLRLPYLKREKAIYAPGMGLGICPQKRMTSLFEQKVIVQEAAHELFPDLILTPEWTKDEYDHFVYYHIAAMVLSSMYSDIVALWHLSGREVKNGLSVLPEEEQFRSFGLLDLYRRITPELNRESLEKLFYALLELNISGDEQPLRELAGNDSPVLEQIIKRFKQYAQTDRKWFGALYAQRFLHPELVDWGKRQSTGLTHNKFLDDFGGNQAKQNISVFLLRRFEAALCWEQPFDADANRAKAALNFFKSQEAIFYRFRGLSVTETGRKAHAELTGIINQLETDAANGEWWDRVRLQLAFGVVRRHWTPMIQELYERGFISGQEKIMYLRYYPYQENKRFFGRRYNDTTAVGHAEDIALLTQRNIAEAEIIEKHFDRSRKYRATVNLHRSYPTSPLLSTALLAKTEDNRILFIQRDGGLALPERFVLADTSMEDNVNKLAQASGVTHKNKITLYDFLSDPQRSDDLYRYTAVAAIQVKSYITENFVALKANEIDFDNIIPEHRTVVQKFIYGYDALSRAHYENDIRIDADAETVDRKYVDEQKDLATTRVHSEFADHGLTQPLIAADAIIECYDDNGAYKGILLVKRSGDNHWATIGGFANRYESVEHAIARKVYEKIGIKELHFERLLRLATHPDRDNRLYGWSPAFVVKTRGELPRLKQDVVDYVFIKSEEELDRLLERKDNNGGIWADHLETLRFYFRHNKNPSRLRMPPFSCSSDVFIDKVKEYDLAAVERSLDALIGAADSRGELFDSVYTALIKPSLASLPNALTRTTTHPVVIEAMISLLKKKGIRRIIFGDGGFHGGNMQEIFTELQLYELAKKYGVELIDLNNLKAYTISIPPRPAQAFKKVKLVDVLKDTDLLINMPKLKTHGQMTITGAMKNLKGVTTPAHKKAAHELYPSEMHKDFGEEAKLSQAIVDNTTAVSMAIPKQLIVVDGIEGMEGFGPTHGDKVKSECLIVGTNPLAIDTAIAKIMKVDPNEIPAIRIARKLGYWKSEPRFKGPVSLEDISRTFVMPKKLATKDYGHFRIVVPEDVSGICSACMGVLAVEYQLSKPEWKKKCRENNLKIVVYIGKIAPLEPLPEGELPVFVGVCPGKYAKSNGVELDENHMIKVCAPGTASVMEVINRVFNDAIARRNTAQTLPETLVENPQRVFQDSCRKEKFSEVFVASAI